MTEKKKFDWDRVGVWITLFFIFLTLIFLLTLKIGGASKLPIDLEKNGYCRLTYDVNYNEAQQKCTNGISFSDEEFREVCPKKEFLSWGFYSECFKVGG